ncbi:hypothetical protein TCAL_04254 [Tigriopus californicus]|uniref:Rab3 GTPase-activating protein catalytic subunit n=1 Tax=Tigriopus californicus TaxID=6832 RepID=A0A553PLH6_TIGCA|nr:rab3 GTPase-activating protein catalytic subunit-like [Tigriopus californicus]TRY78537.1 hypothetical protein TCAL_04254 [Tigriopus californicus]|eukprot:TCALIF_04254-PA protein Name:"Similar to rab3gap1 Rab3 GTPase-activating protein catalytic subunit (Xenopus laevis)" AED:0.03 eAED:0.03 QI:165/1/1/1/0.8/0.66/6/595/995
MTHLGPHLRHYGPVAPAAHPGSSTSPIQPKLMPPLTDTFEIEDFTALSDWEKFVAGFEDILRDWGVSHYHPPPDPAPTNATSPGVPWVWRQTRREIRFMDCGFWVTRFLRTLDVADDPPTVPPPTRSDGSVTPGSRACQSLMNGENDFPCSAHPIYYFYGLDEFIILSPQGTEQVDNPTRIKMVLGTLSVAAHNTECGIPMFIQVMQRSQAQFAGLCVNDRFRTMFEMAVLPKVPSSCRNLSEILYVFQEKLSQPLPMSVRGCRCTLRRTYRLEDWTSHAWTQAPPDFELFAMFGGQLGYLNDLRQLPFGAGQDPVKRLLLNTTWPGLVEETVLENDVHNDLDPLEAPSWSVSVQFEEQPQCLLGQYLRQFVKVSENHESMLRVLGDFFNQSDYDVDESVDNVPNALKRLTGPTYGLTDIIKSGRSRRNSNQPGPIKDDYLFKILEYLFPDSTDKPEFPYPQDFGSPSHRHNENFNNFRVLLSTIKSCPVDGLLWRFTIVAAHCLHILGGIKPLAHLMHEFMLEIRFRWENGRKLPGLPHGPPDHSYCLFHQKLQMINYCIDRKLARESVPNQSNEEAVTPKNDENSDEEFFDCDEDEEIEVDETKTNAADLPIWNQKPAGRAERLGKTMLLHHNDFMYVPICQEPAPMTDDQLAEQAEILLQLGSDAEGSELRAKMQSASLLSDMESFKAANPGSVLADFVRWHSPRDWIESQKDNGEKGKLSVRMMTPGNAWAEAWESAKPVPARRQKRLFDDTREAEKAIKFLTSLKPGEATQTLMPTFLHAAIHRLLLETLDNVPNLKDIISTVLPVLARLARFSCRPEVQHYSSETLPEFDTRTNLVRDVVQRLSAAEIKLSQALSLRAKFTKDVNFVKEKAQLDDQEQVARQMEDFVRQLYSCPEVKVVGASRGPAGQLIQKMFKEAEKATQMITDDMEAVTDAPLKVFPAPVSREYIIRVAVPRPFPYSAKSPQRLYVCIKDKEFRLAGAFTLDKEYL